MKNLAVYLGSSGRCRDIFKNAAQELGRLIGQNNNTLVYGGMDAGLMGIVANNALSAGASVTGIIPKSLKDSERIHPNLSQTILVPDLWERKLKMFKRADAIIALAGGFGTIDEVLEVLYWADLESHSKPVILVNTDNYWDDFISYTKALPDLRADLFKIANTVEDVFDITRAWNVPNQPKQSENFPHFEDMILQDTDEPLIFEEATVKDSYYLATALGLKQLGKHSRHIGLLNTSGQFDPLLRWIDHAQNEKFITDHCKDLFSVSDTHKGLMAQLDDQKTIKIDLHNDKWGPGETKTHIELKETE